MMKTNQEQIKDMNEKQKRLKDKIREVVGKYSLIFLYFSILLTGVGIGILAQPLPDPMRSFKFWTAIVFLIGGTLGTSYVLSATLERKEKGGER